MTEAALLAAVLDDYDDDLPRLALADYWEEHGQSERSEFVRVQVALAALPAWVPGKPNEQGFISHGVPNARVEAFRRREGELLKAVPAGATSANKFFWLDNATFEATVMGGASPEVVSSGLVWRRGFVHAVTCTAADWLEHGDAILAAQPVEEVTLTTLPGWQWVEGQVGFSVGPPSIITRAGWRNALGRRWGRVRHWHLPPALHGLPETIHGYPVVVEDDADDDSPRCFCNAPLDAEGRCTAYRRHTA